MEKVTPKKMLCDTMYKMFKDNHLEYLDMEDFIVMWQSLADKWSVNCNDWDLFAEDINSQASNRHSVFTEIFNTYFE